MTRFRCFPRGSVLPAVVVCLVVIALGIWFWRGQPGAHSGEAHQTGKSASTAAQAPRLGAPVPPGAAPSGKVPEADLAKSGAHSHEKKLANFDARSVKAGVPAADQRPALEAMRKKVPGVEVQFDSVTGSPDHINATGRFLTDAAAPGGDVYAPVRRFISDNAALFGHGGEALADSRLTREDVTAHNGMRTVVWQQQVDGIPVYNTIIKANLTKDGSLVTIGSRFMRDAVAATQMDAPARAALAAQPPVDAKKAVSLAAANLGDAVSPELAVAASSPEGAERKQRFTAPKLSDTVAQLAWLPMNAGSARLTWDVTLMSLKQNEMFRVLVDARTGEVLVRTSLTNDISDASYRVYADGTTKKPYDSPAPMLPGTSTASGTQGAEVPRNLVTLQAVDTTASPNGWINDGGTETLGNNVDAHTDTNADNVADLPRPTSATRVFDFPVNLTQAPSTYKDAAATHLFYINNWMHDQLYGLGFTESAGNFQTDNFGRGGSGNDAVQSDAQDGSGTDNANMSTPADGSAPRMQMYVFTGPTPDRDGDFDDVIVLHEYTHGLSNRLVGGGVGISALATGGMGEGWSDFYGLALMADPASDPNAVYPGGSYATLQFVPGMTTNYYYGIRRYPYSTDMTKNPLTLRDIDPTQASPHTGIPLSPLFGSSNGSPSEVHNVGEVWCVTLWECRANLIAKLGPIGNQKVLQLVTDGMKLSPPNPTFLQARDAIIQADLVNNAGANRNELWAAFAKRGMGVGATVPASSSTSGVVESFELPDDLSVTPAGAFLATGDAGGPFTPAANTYTLTNFGAAGLDWTAVDNAAWLDLSAASGSLASGATATVTATLNAAAASLADGLYSATITFTNTVSGAAIARIIHLRVGQVDYFTEVFDTSAHDIDNQSFLFTPNTTASGYSVRREPVTAFFTDPSGGASLLMSDDTSVQVTPTGGQQVQLFGVSYASFYVGSNGYITFTSGDTGYMESAATHFSLPRVAALMDDLLPTTGQVTWRQTADRVAVTWQGVSQWGEFDSNNFQIELFFDGRIRITNLAIDATDGLIGLSRGTGAPADFIESDFSTYPSFLLGLIFPAVAMEGDAPVTGTVTASIAPASDLVVSLASSDTTGATVPATVTILAGQTSATFPITIIEDTKLDGTQNTAISATATGYSDASAVIAVQDNETATLVVTVPAATVEGAVSVQGMVMVSSAPASAVGVSMTSSDTTAVQVPATVTIPAGQTSADFTITVIDDTQINGTHPATITAHVANWTDGAASIAVQDNENTDLALALPLSVVEGGAGTGTVSISGTLASALVVSLSSDNVPRLTVPATVSIPAGSTSATFTLTAPDNTLLDGTQSVTITASASGFTSGVGGTSVLDDDAHHYAFSVIPSPQYKGVAFSVTITAQDANNATLTDYAGTPALTASGSVGAVSVSPASADGFVDGVWTGNVTVNTVAGNVVLTATDGSGHTGASNAFNVAAPPDYFTELFGAGSPNDTDNQSWLFTPDGSASFYSVARTPAVASFPTDPTGGTTLTLSDDTYAPVTPGGGVQVKLYGISYSTFYVGSNGYVTFGSGDPSLTESLASHFSRPRVAALFDDLNPATGGTVTWKQLADRIAVTFQGVPEYSSSNSNSFQIELFFDGRIRITCLGIAATDGLIGLSRGQGVPGGFVVSDFSAYPVPPTVVTLAATLITPTSATLNGTVNPNGQATTAKFEYGPTTAYGSPVTATLAPNDGSSTLPVAANLTGFTPGTTYHFHATATNPDGTTDGGDLSFTTLTLVQSWRLQYFGTVANSGDAADTSDPDGDGGSNLFEYVAGLLPNDPLSRFNVRVETVPGQPGQKAIVFSPLVPGRTYVTKSKANLTDPAWTALTSFTTSDNVDERTVIDLAAGAGQKFYIVEIALP